MREPGIWRFYIVFTDHMGQLLPKHSVSAGDCIVQKQNLMGGKYSEDSEQNAPPN